MFFFTDVAATAYGRELLMTKACGRHVIDVFLSAVFNIPPKLAYKLKKYATDLSRFLLVLLAK